MARRQAVPSHRRIYGILLRARGPVEYIDTLQVRMDPPPTTAERGCLATSGALMDFPSNPDADHLGFRIDGHGRAAMRLLRAVVGIERARTVAGCRSTVRVQRVDLAWDLLPRDNRDKRILRAFFDECIVQRWLRKGHVQYSGATRYSRSARWPERRLVIYSDSYASRKHPGAPPCLHLEVRLRGSQTVRRVVGGTTPRAVMAFDRLDFWREAWGKALVFERACPAAIRRSYLRHRREEGSPVVGDRRALDVLRRAISADDCPGEPEMTAQRVRDTLRGHRWFSSAKSFVPLDVASVLASLVPSSDT